MTEFKNTNDSLSKYYLTHDDKILKLFDIVRKIVPTKIPVLITGEHGVGKEKFAKAIHIASDQPKGRFIEAHCANLPPNFFELELFGIPKTYFTDMQPMTPRYFDVCTLMLDEVANLDKHLQFTLLRILREQETPHTSNQMGTAVDARIIACSAKNLQSEVNAGRFNPELYAKLNVIHFEIPPLRTRPIDIGLYAEMFLAEFNAQYSKKVVLTGSAKQSLRQYTWPGNVRELQNVLQRAVLLNVDQIDCEDLHWISVNTPTEIAMASPLPQITISELEHRLILQTLRRLHGNRTHTAKALGISLRTLRYKLKELLQYGYEVDTNKLST